MTSIDTLPPPDSVPKPKKYRVTFISVICFLMVCSFMNATIRETVSLYQFSTAWIPVEASVLSCVTIREYRRKYIKAQIQFRTADGKPIQVTDTFQYSYIDAVGQKIRIRYNPEDPNDIHAETYTQSKIRDILAVGFLSLVFFVFTYLTSKVRETKVD